MPPDDVSPVVTRTSTSCTRAPGRCGAPLALDITCRRARPAHCGDGRARGGWETGATGAWAAFRHARLGRRLCGGARSAIGWRGRPLPQRAPRSARANPLARAQAGRFHMDAAARRRSRWLGPEGPQLVA